MSPQVSDISVTIAYISDCFGDFFRSFWRSSTRYCSVCYGVCARMGTNLFGVRSKKFVGRLEKKCYLCCD